MSASYEEVTIRQGDHIIASNIRPATEAEVLDAERQHQAGKCPHTIVKDEAGFMYDTRTCVTCGAGLGLI